jgi:hypothetical protein
MAVIETRSKEHPMCSFCGEREAVAVWRGALSEILVCTWCATETLPKFAADAIISDQVGPHTLRVVAAARSKMDTSFFYAAFLSTVRAQIKGAR